MGERQSRGVGLTLIAAGKLIQVLLVLAVGAAALLFVDRVPPESLKQWVDAFAPDSPWLQKLIDKLVSASDDRLAFVGRVSFAYAALFTVEGLGLWFSKRWAEYLTALVTTSFLPFEIMGLVHEFSVAKLVGLVVNGAVVIFLVLRILRDRKSRRAREH